MNKLFIKIIYLHYQIIYLHFAPPPPRGGGGGGRNGEAGWKGMGLSGPKVSLSGIPGLCDVRWKPPGILMSLSSSLLPHNALLPGSAGVFLLNV